MNLFHLILIIILSKGGYFGLKNLKIGSILIKNRYEHTPKMSMLLNVNFVRSISNYKTTVKVLNRIPIKIRFRFELTCEFLTTSYRFFVQTDVQIEFKSFQI